MAGCQNTHPAIKQLNSLLNAAMTAHEAIFEMRRKPIAADRVSPEQALLLQESARIIMVELSGLSANTRQLSIRWSEQSAPDPEGAAHTEMEIEPDRVEPRFRPTYDRSSDRPPNARDAGIAELCGGEPGYRCLLIAICQSQSCVAIALDVGLRRLGTKLLSTRRELPWRLLSLRQQFLHQLDRPAVLLRDVWPRMSGHGARV